MLRQLEQPLDKKTWLLAQQQNRLHKVLVECRIISNQILPFRMQIEGVFEPGVWVHNVSACLYLEDRDFFDSRALILAS